MFSVIGETEGTRLDVFAWNSTKQREVCLCEPILGMHRKSDSPQKLRKGTGKNTRV
jgi:hypothetical protein